MGIQCMWLLRTSFCLLLSVNSEKKKKKDLRPRLSRPGGTPRSETNPDLSVAAEGRSLTNDKCGDCDASCPACDARGGSRPAAIPAPDRAMPHRSAMRRPGRRLLCPVELWGDAAVRRVLAQRQVSPRHRLLRRQRNTLRTLRANPFRSAGKSTTRCFFPPDWEASELIVMSRRAQRVCPPGRAEVAVGRAVRDG